MAEKTEEPTQKKLRDARRRGEVARSADLGVGVGVLAAVAALAWVGSRARESLVALVATASTSMDAGPDVALAWLERGAVVGLSIVAPLLVVAVLAGGGLAFLQVGPLFAPAAVSARLDRVDPVTGFRRLFDRSRLVMLLLSIGKLAVIAGVAAWSFEEVAATVGRVVLATPGTALLAGASLGRDALLLGGVALTAIGVLDLLHQRARYRRERRMSRDEVRREVQEQEGDPRYKQSRQAAHREIVEHATLEEVRCADVLVVNPTHLAVALRYDPGGELDAPEVCARGRDDLAQRMIRAAEAAGVPVLREVDLAHALHALDVGEPVPERLFDAVAAVLQAAWRLRDEAAEP